jgi:hypothetical protein
MTFNGVRYEHDVAFLAFQDLCAHRLFVAVEERAARTMSKQHSIYIMVLSGDELEFGLSSSSRSTPALRDALMAPLRSQQAGTCAWS